MASTRSRRAALRAVSGLWLVVAAILIIGLTAELWLQYERRGDRIASERFRATNIFFAKGMELNVGNHSLWHVRWKEYMPGARLDVVAGGERFVVQMNSEGYRTHEFAVPKPAGLVRIVCLGGSTTVAGRTNDETYPALLEKKLRARFPGLRLEVLNLGVSSVTTEYWLERLGRVLAYEPDVIIQYQGINDISWRHLPRYAQAHPQRGRAYRSLLVQRLFPFPAEELDPYLEDTFETLGTIAGISRDRGIAYLGATFAAPDPERTEGAFRRHLDYNAEYWMRKFPMHSYATWAGIVERYNRLFEDYAWRNHLTYVPLHETLHDPALFIDVCHFTPEGIERLADTFVPSVAELVRDTPPGRRWASAAPGGAGHVP